MTWELDSPDTAKSPTSHDPVWCPAASRGSCRQLASALRVSQPLPACSWQIDRPPLPPHRIHSLHSPFPRSLGSPLE